jgi:ribosomal protein L13E
MSTSGRREEANERARRARERQRDQKQEAWKGGPPVVVAPPLLTVSDEVAQEEAEKRGITPGEVKSLGLTTEQALALKIDLETMDHDDHGIRRPDFSYSTSQPSYTFIKTIDGGF